jgi:hypothetical protein
MLTVGAGVVLALGILGWVLVRQRQAREAGDPPDTNYPLW